MSEPASPDRAGQEAGLGALVPSDAASRAFAVDPARNVVLEASAGTGKTTVLVNRYLNLIHADVDPSNILAITFTRKAAAEMRERIVRELKKAAALSSAEAVRWRELRDRLGDIAICTIDAFCLSLLREFPLEADLDPGFEVADETETLRLTEEALDRTLRLCRGMGARNADVAYVFARLGEGRTRAALESLLERRLVAAGALSRFLSVAPSTLTAEGACRRAADGALGALDLAVGGRDQFLDDGPLRNARFALLAAEIRGQAAAGDPASLRTLLGRLEQHLFTQAGTPRKKFGPLYRNDDFPSDAARARHLADIALVAPAMRDIIGGLDRDLNVIVTRGVRRMFHVARSEYRRALDARAVVDFSEGLARALSLLGRMDEFAQSRYRLEARYHHVLVDEFQDTSRAQWHLVAKLIEAWGAGAGLAHEAVVPPSIFIVGDRKQSIYGFRDADVRVFRTARRHVERLREDRDVRRTLTHSFRAVPALQAFVNDLFAAVVKERGRDDAFRYGAGDRFPESPRGPDGDDGAVGAVVAANQGAVAAAVAAEIERLLAGEIVRDRQSGVRRPAAPGDIAILFRARESHREFEQALTVRSIPTYVYKGLGFFDADETKDLVALLRFLANPSSDARAAAFLRSRFVRLSDVALRQLSPGAGAVLLAKDVSPAIAPLGEEDRGVLLRARTSVAAWTGLVDRLPHAELLDRILVESAYAFEARGPRLRQARENLKKMRALVRRIQNRGYVTMGRIADHLDRLSAGDESNATIDAADAVSLMTVHAAKGLEFPVVFIVNIERGAGGRADPVVVTFAGRPRRPLVSIDGMLDEADAEVRGRDREETKRLMYVAVTRARDRLYLAASLKDGALRCGRGSLAELLPDSLRNTIVEARHQAAGGRVEWVPAPGKRHEIRVCRPPDVPPNETGVVAKAAPLREADDFGALAARPGVRRTSVTNLVSPAGAPEAAGGETLPSRGAEMGAELVGTLVHRLFQFDSQDWTLTPTIEDATSRARLLCQADETALVDELEPLLRRAAGVFLALRGRPDVQSTLTSGTCLFEVPYSAVMDDESNGDATQVIRGTIDCLVRQPAGHVLVVDFKTGAPRAEHAAQLALYIQAARTLCDTADVEGVILYADAI
jgi:ATP-dependent helicase/nuclease subunit A